MMVRLEGGKRPLCFPEPEAVCSNDRVLRLGRAPPPQGHGAEYASKDKHGMRMVCLCSSRVRAVLLESVSEGEQTQPPKPRSSEKKHTPLHPVMNAECARRAEAEIEFLPKLATKRLERSESPLPRSGTGADSPLGCALQA